MLGLNSNGNSWKYAIANFIITFFSELVLLAYGKALLTGVFPTDFDVYFMALTALATTIIFYGVNKATKKAE